MADTTLHLPPCRVCGGRSTGRHFGVVACEACKSFFKRNKNRDKPYKCKGQTPGKCIVKFNKTPICPYCRLQVCLQVGMSRDAIHRGRVPIDKKTELLLEAREHQMAMEKKKREEEMEEEKEKEEGTNSKQHNHPISKSAPVHGLVETTVTRTTEPIQEHMRDGTQVDAILEVPEAEVPMPDSPGLPEVNQTEIQVTSQSDVSMTPLSPKSPWSPEGEINYSKLLCGQAELFSTVSPLMVDQIVRCDSLDDELSDLSDLSPSIQEDVMSNGADFTSQVLKENFTNEEIEFQQILSLIDTAKQIDQETLLYQPEELANATLKTINFLSHRAAKEQLFGDMRPLPEVVYNEIYKTTGIDLDDYRRKVYGCVQDIRPDMDAFLKYLCRLPNFKDFGLNDRTLLAKGGFAGWMIISSSGIYSCDLEVWSCTYDIIFTTDDFVRYFGKEYSDSLREVLTVLQKRAITEEEISLLKFIHVYRERPELGSFEKREILEEYQRLLWKALVYVMETNRGPEEAKIVLDEVTKIFPWLDRIGAAFMNGVKQWPVKFPEVKFPRIMMEMIGEACEEELLVAVSVQLNLND